MIEVPFCTLQGLLLTGYTVSENRITFETEEGREFILEHPQDCSERVELESVTGDLEDLIGSPILRAEERSDKSRDSYGDTVEWTFYTLATVKGWVDLRWHGTSNGYYSTSVHLYTYEYEMDW